MDIKILNLILNKIFKSIKKRVPWSNKLEEQWDKEI